MEQGKDEMQGFERVCALENVPEHMPLRVEYGGRGVLICRDGEDVYAVDEICPHENESMRRAVVFNKEIICPHHQYRFKLETGRCNRRCAPLQVYRVKIDGGEVWVST